MGATDGIATLRAHFSFSLRIHLAFFCLVLFIHSRARRCSACTELRILKSVFFAAAGVSYFALYFVFFFAAAAQARPASKCKSI